jgi:hypothetical protein
MEQRHEEEVPLLLAGSEKAQLIDSIKSKEVSFSIIKRSPKLREFYIFCFQEKRYDDAFYFVPEAMKDDAYEALKNIQAHFCVHVIPINNNDIKKLAAKSSAGCAQKMGKWIDDVRWYGDSIESVCDFKVLTIEKIKNAMMLPEQNSDEKNKAWSCGPNSGYRALYLLGEEIGAYGGFVESCPRTINRENILHTAHVSTVVGSGLMLGHSFLNPESLMAGLGTLMAGVGASIIAHSLPNDVGPKPEELAKYLSKKMLNYEAFFSGYFDNTDYYDVINQNIEQKYPTIALIISSAFNMHYINIIGINNISREFLILDTDGTIGVISESKLEYWLNRDGIASLLLDAQYNFIEFEKCSSR